MPTNAEGDACLRCVSQVAGAPDFPADRMAKELQESRQRSHQRYVSAMDAQLREQREEREAKRWTKWSHDGKVYFRRYTDGLRVLNLPEGDSVRSAWLLTSGPALNCRAAIRL